MSSLFRRSLEPAQYDESARAAVVAAQDEAAALRHPAIHVEHFLLGVLAVDGPGRRVLEGFGVTLDDLRAEVAIQRPPGTRTPRGGIPFDPSTRPVLERAAEAACGTGAAEVTSAHVLLGVLATGELAAELLAAHGVDRDRVQRALLPEAAPAPTSTLGAATYFAVDLEGGAAEWTARLNELARDGWTVLAVVPLAGGARAVVFRA